jgi:hypothetical protein
MAKIKNALQKLPKKPAEQLVEQPAVQPVIVEQSAEKSITVEQPVIIFSDIVFKIDGIEQAVKNLTIQTNDIKKYVQVNSDLRHNGTNWQYKNQDDSLNFEELTNLIQIRQYVVHAINDFTVDRPTVSEMNGTLLLIDKKILEILKGSEFKKYIGYSDVRKVIEDAARVKSNLHSKKDS